MITVKRALHMVKAVLKPAMHLKGEKGDPGPMGPMGPMGARGESGVTPVYFAASMPNDAKPGSICYVTEDE